jgi:hypothetical protein
MARHQRLTPPVALRHGDAGTDPLQPEDVDRAFRARPPERDRSSEHSHSHNSESSQLH